MSLIKPMLANNDFQTSTTASQPEPILENPCQKHGFQYGLYLVIQAPIRGWFITYFFQRN